MRLRVQASRRVGDQDVDAAGLRRLQRVEHDGRGIRAGRLRDDGDAVALRPDGELLDGRGAERVAGREHHRQSLALEAPRQLADRRRLARAVHADDQDHVRLLRPVDGERALDGLQDREQRVGERRLERAGVRELGALDLAVQVRQDDLGRVDPDVGGEQARLELLEQRRVDAPPRQEVGNPGGAAIDARAQAREEAALGRRQGSRMAGFVIANAAPPEAASEAACVCISVVTATLAAGESSEPCEPEVKCTQVPVPAATALSPGVAVFTKGAALMSRCVAEFGTTVSFSTCVSSTGRAATALSM